MGISAIETEEINDLVGEVNDLFRDKSTRVCFYALVTLMAHGAALKFWSLTNLHVSAIATMDAARADIEAYEPPDSTIN